MSFAVTSGSSGMKQMNKNWLMVFKCLTKLSHLYNYVRIVFHVSAMTTFSWALQDKLQVGQHSITMNSCWGGESVYIYGFSLLMSAPTFKIGRDNNKGQFKYLSLLNTLEN